MDIATPTATVDARTLLLDYVRRTLPRERTTPSTVRIEQRGTMWRSPGGRGLSFTAEQRFETSRVEFAWRARFAMMPAVSLTVEDAFVGGHGHLEGRLWDRIRVLRSVGPEIDRGQILRYLAELPWNPYAILGNDALRWRVLGPRRLEVALAGATTPCAIEMSLDEHGDIAQVGTAARGYVDGKTIVMRPWGGRFWDYAMFDGVRMPRCAEVWWDLPSGRFTYWRGELTAVKHAW
ncbi:MAG TPA: DUF6544 family protein [Nannocystaceae bacterium]|nr:DUF6544 family protein [Nannocystaceae bacterium]